MPVGDYHGARNQGMPPRTRDSPSTAISILDRGRKLTPVPSTHQAQTPMAVGRNGGRSMVRHMDTGTPMGYSFPFEATVTYVKDSWCQPACMCLTQAVSSGDLGRVNAALNGNSPFTRKHSINQQDESGRTAAMVAAWRGECAILKWLISKGVDMNIVDFDGRGVLHWAVSVESAAPSLIQAIATSNVDPMIKDRHGDTALHRAISRNFTEAVRVLATSFPHLVLERDKKGRLPLDLVPPKKARMRKAVSLQAALEVVKERQEEFMAHVTQEEEKKKQQKLAKALQEADAAAKKRREALVNKAKGQSFIKVEQLDEIPDDFAALDEEAEQDDVEEENVSFFTNLIQQNAAGGNKHAQKVGADGVHHLAAEGAEDDEFSRTTSGGEHGKRRSSVSVMKAVPGPGRVGRRREGVMMTASNGPLVPVEILRDLT